MRPRRSLALLASIAGLCLFAVGTSSSLDGSNPLVSVSLGEQKSIVTDLETVKTGAGTPPSKSFTIEGSIAGLFPGATKQIPLIVRNPNKQEIWVTRLRISVGSIGPCDGSNVWVTDFSGSLRVGPQSASTQLLAIGMNASAGNECKNAVFPLTFSGSAEMR